MKLFTFIIFMMLICSSTFAETIKFNSQGTIFDIEFVEVGEPGNRADFDERFPGDQKTLGSVGYVFSVSKYEASCDGFRIFTNGKLECPGTFPVTTSEDGIIGYVNWLNDIKGYPHAYDVEFPTNGPTPVPVRNMQARFFITTADEWHKSAYYDPVTDIYYDYATGGDTRPMSIGSGVAQGTAVLSNSPGVAPVELAGGASPFGTVGQTGNRPEIEENLRWYRWGIDSLGVPEAHFGRVDASELSGSVGFRIVSIPPVPEPSSMSLAVLGCFSILLVRRRSPWAIRPDRESSFI